MHHILPQGGRCFITDWDGSVAPQDFFRALSNAFSLRFLSRSFFGAQPPSRRSATRGATTTPSSGRPVTRGCSPATRAPPRTSTRTGACARRLDAAQGGKQVGGRRPQRWQSRRKTRTSFSAKSSTSSSSTSSITLASSAARTARRARRNGGGQGGGRSVAGTRRRRRTTGSAGRPHRAPQHDDGEMRESGGGVQPAPV